MTDLIAQASACIGEVDAILAANREATAAKIASPLLALSSGTTTLEIASRKRFPGPMFPGSASSRSPSPLWDDRVSSLEPIRGTLGSPQEPHYGEYSQRLTRERDEMVLMDVPASSPPSAARTFLASGRQRMMEATYETGQPLPPPPLSSTSATLAGGTEARDRMMMGEHASEGAVWFAQGALGPDLSTCSTSQNPAPATARPASAGASSPNPLARSSQTAQGAGEGGAFGRRRPQDRRTVDQPRRAEAHAGGGGLAAPTTTGAGVSGESTRDRMLRQTYAAGGIRSRGSCAYLCGGGEGSNNGDVSRENHDWGDSVFYQGNIGSVQAVLFPPVPPPPPSEGPKGVAMPERRGTTRARTGGGSALEPAPPFVQVPTPAASSCAQQPLSSGEGGLRPSPPPFRPAGAAVAVRLGSGVLTTNSSSSRNPTGGSIFDVVRSTAGGRWDAASEVAVATTFGALLSSEAPRPRVEDFPAATSPITKRGSQAVGRAPPSPATRSSKVQSRPRRSRAKQISRPWR